MEGTIKCHQQVSSTAHVCDVITPKHCDCVTLTAVRVVKWSAKFRTLREQVRQREADVFSTSFLACTHFFSYSQHITTSQIQCAKALPCTAVDNVLLQKTLQLVLGARGPQVADPCYDRPIKLSLQNFEGHGVRIFNQNVTSLEGLSVGVSRNWIWRLLSNPLKFKEYTTFEILISRKTSALIGDEWSASRSGRSTPGERPPLSIEPQSRNGRFGEHRNLLFLPGFEPYFI